MAIRKKIAKTTKTTKTATKVNEPKISGACVTTVEQIFMRDRRLTVSIGISSDYGKEKVGLSLSENVREDADPMELADKIYGLLEVKMEEQFAILQGEDTPEDSEYETDDEFEKEEEETEETEEEETEESDEEEEEISEDDIKAMKKPELLDLIKEEELDIDLKKCKKIADLRDAVIDALFEEEIEEDGEEEEENEDGDDWEDEDWDDEDE